MPDIVMHKDAGGGYTSDELSGHSSDEEDSKNYVE